MNDEYDGSEIKVCLVKHSTNNITRTVAKWSNRTDNQAQLRSPEVLVRVQSHLVLLNYCDQYEMMPMLNRLLIN
jgi:hypothetical protein